MYDLNGNEILGYDIGGNPYSSTSGTDAGIVRNHTKTPTSLNASYGTNIEDSYNAFKASYEAHPTSIPFFVITDQHGAGMNLERYVNNLDVDGINFIKFQLGDFCYDYFTASAMENLSFYSKGINGLLTVPGNHEYKDSNGEFNSDVLKASFGQDVSWFGCKFMNSQYKCYTALDLAHNLKIIMVDPYDANGFISGMAHPYYNTDVVNWLIDELTNDDGYDILYVQHEPIYEQYYDRTSETPTVYSNATSLRIRPLILARKNKESGAYTDSDGVSHSYDFTGCTGELLMSLHGHIHAERYDTTGFTSYACINGYGGTFGLIDRDAGLLRVWVFSYGDTIYDELDIALIGV